MYWYDSLSSLYNLLIYRKLSLRLHHKVTENEVVSANSILPVIYQTDFCIRKISSYSPGHIRKEYCLQRGIKVAHSFKTDQRTLDIPAIA